MKKKEQSEKNTQPTDRTKLAQKKNACFCNIMAMEPGTLNWQLTKQNYMDKKKDIMGKKKNK